MVVWREQAVDALREFAAGFFAVIGVVAFCTGTLSVIGVFVTWVVALCCPQFAASCVYPIVGYAVSLLVLALAENLT